MYPRVTAFARAILERVPTGAHVLEIGCGEGQLTQALREGGCKVTPIDPKPRAPFNVVQVTFGEFDSPARHFDCIATQLVLHHAPDLDAFLRKAELLIRPTGIIAIDDYGWERAADEVSEQWREERRDLHTSRVMLDALERRFTRKYYADHAYFDDGAGSDTLAFTFIGSLRS